MGWVFVSQRAGGGVGGFVIILCFFFGWCWAGLGWVGSLKKGREGAVCVCV